MKLFSLCLHLKILVWEATVSAFSPMHVRQATTVTTNTARFLLREKPGINDRESMSLEMFGGFFGGGGGKLVLDDTGELVVYTCNPSDSDYEVEFEGLSDYIQKWAQLFTTGGIRLTTPVQVTSINSDEVRGARLVFQNIDTGYKSKKEEGERSEEGKAESEKPVTKQGGLQFLVEKAGVELRVRAQRCEIDEGTIIKEMSEETILEELKQAIDVWKKEK